MIKIFDDESAMQKWLRSEFDKGKSFSDIIVNFEQFEQLASNKNQSHGVEKISESFLYCLSSLHDTEVIVENENISLSEKDVLKPDFLLYAKESESVVIVELKNIKGPTRQVGTELGAYAAEVKSYLPYLADGDIINVIISSEWPTLLRHYIFNDIFWLGRKLICLQPLINEYGIGLQIIEPKTIADSETNFVVSMQQLGGYHLCLYDNRIYNGGDYYQMEENENQMRCAMAAMAAEGNSLKSHGFAFLWRYNFEAGLAPYIITIVNLASFQSLPRQYLNEGYQPNKTAKRFLKIVKDHVPEGHGNVLDTICDAGVRFLKNFSHPSPENYMSWGELKDKIFKDGLAISFVGWGMFNDLFIDRLAEEYESGEFNPECDNPLLAIQMLNEMISYDEVRLNWSKIRFE